MRLVWRIPLRAFTRGEAQAQAHLMPALYSTDALYKTACGLDVNPGFAAIPAKGTKRCLRCALAHSATKETESAAS